MLRKFLFVGLGGSGGKTLRFLRHDLQRWLQQIGWQGSSPSAFPVGWQMLHIDTPTAQDGIEISDVPMLPAENYVGLVGPGISFDTVAKSLVGDNGDRWRDLATWRVDPVFLGVPIAAGAGQFRAVGRSIGLAYADQINHALRAAAARLSTAEAGGELSEIHQKAYGEVAATPPEPVVVVVSSLAGGTGAGLLMDTCDLLRQISPTWGDESFAILYGSDVFSQLGSIGMSGIQPNTLAAVCEVLNGHWLTATHQRTNALLSAAGAPVPIDRSGPRFPFLVGASNSKGVSFGDQKNVYKMMGRAMRSWTIDPKVQINLIQYTKANWAGSAAGNAVRADVLLKHHVPVFEAYGFAEVNLGVDRFGEYARKRLARSAAEWVYDAHNVYWNAVNPGVTQPPSVIIDEIAREQLVGYLKAARLHERSAENNDVIDAIKPPDEPELRAAAEETVFSQSVHGIRMLNQAGWVDRIMPFLEVAAAQYEQDCDQAIRVEVRNWVDTTPQRVLDATSEMVSRFGLQVTRRVIELAMEECQGVVGELLTEAEEYIGWATEARGAILSTLDAKGRIPPTHPSVKNAVEEGVWTSGGYRMEAKRRQIAAKLLEEFVSGFLEPLAKALLAAFQNLDIKGFKGEGTLQPSVINWPLEAVPDNLRPPKNEQLVIRIDDFPAHFDRLIGRSTVADALEEERREARDAVIDGSFMDDLPDDHRRPASPFTITTNWAPDPSLTIGGGTVRNNATFATAFDPEDMLQRATAWLERPGTAFEVFLDADLRSYLDDDPAVEPAERGDRRQNFRMALNAALDSAEPLVHINSQLRTLLHGKPTPSRARPGEVPFRDHPMEDEVKQILLSSLGQELSTDDVLTTSQRVTGITINSTLGAAHDPLIFTSISEPIISGWAKAKNTPAAQNFWNNRRARPLNEFVPASQELLLAMTRGWFTGLLLGKIDRENRTIVHRDGVAAFPDELLTPTDSASRSLLPALLESLGLAFTEVAKLNVTTPLDAYSALRDLGIEPATTDLKMVDLYRTPSEPLRTWLMTGDYGTQLAQPLARVDDPDAGPDERKKIAIDLIATSYAAYQSDWAEYERTVLSSPGALGPGYGLWQGMYSMISQALEQLQQAIDKLHASAAPPM